MESLATLRVMREKKITYCNERQSFHERPSLFDPITGGARHSANLALPVPRQKEDTSRFPYEDRLDSSLKRPPISRSNRSPRSNTLFLVRRLSLFHCMSRWLITAIPSRFLKIFPCQYLAPALGINTHCFGVAVRSRFAPLPPSTPF